MIENELKKKLLNKAIEVSKNSYSPYSKFVVGAAVLTDKGEIFCGTNVENVSYGLTICAERIGVGAAISNGAKKIIAIAIYSPNGDVSPCGACRQFIREFGSDIIVIFTQDNKIIEKTISNLLPDSFTKIT